MLKAVPYLAIPVVIYAIAGFIGGTAVFDRVLFSFGLPSGGVFGFTNGAGILALALAALLVEVLKSTNVKNSNSIIDHGLSTLLLVAAILMFVLWAGAATVTFFILMLMCFIDVIAGFSVSVKTAQRDFQVDRSFT